MITRMILVLIVFVFSNTGIALAYSSANYRIDEGYIGGGGDVQGSSPSFKSDSVIDEVGTGNAASSNYQSNSGYITSGDPALTFIVNAANINFSLSTSATATATSTFSVVNYTSYGYSVQTIGAPPKMGSYTLSGMSTAGPAQVGTEQYGINLKANTLPTSLGSNPSGGLGVAASGYDTANNYKYVAGDTIASAPKSSGQTNFTISYIFNASNLTAAGGYAGTQTLICTATY